MYLCSSVIVIFPSTIREETFNIEATVPFLVKKWQKLPLNLNEGPILARLSLAWMRHVVIDSIFALIRPPPKLLLSSTFLTTARPTCQFFWSFIILTDQFSTSCLFLQIIPIIIQHPQKKHPSDLETKRSNHCSFFFSTIYSLPTFPSQPFLLMTQGMTRNSKRTKEELTTQPPSFLMKGPHNKSFKTGQAFTFIGVTTFVRFVPNRLTIAPSTFSDHHICFCCSLEN
mmetsp:Transcript_21648/g.45212  ORF Transcript_21648/g.45212 Transcript_21648/m.45212 type:complete len:228 (-) Transcript_21648:1305-1988(-)